MKYRKEHDMLEEKAVPADAYYGIHTVRASENFQVCGRPVRRELIHAMAIVKKACCMTNSELGFIEKSDAAAIITACDDVFEGKFDNEFIVDALQGGAGTSTNMNVNEVIANRALELLGCSKGEYSRIAPLEHINLHQSTNDVYPTALKVATIFKLRKLSDLLTELQQACQRREQEFADIIKIGRTELQDAVPMTLGAEFSAFAEAFSRDRWRTFKAEERIRTVNLGGTAIGTGLTAPRSYIFLVIEKLRELTGLGLSRGENCVDQTANNDAFVEVSAMLEACAVNMIKISKDLRQLHFLGEIKLKALQAGSSIMPGKVNPVLPESIIQGAMSVRACHQLCAECAASGTLQINEFMPLLADSILNALELLCNLSTMMKKCIDGVMADKEKCQKLFNACPTTITAFLPGLGYEKTLELLQKFQQSGGDDIREFMNNELGIDTVNKVLTPENLMSLGHR
jgi:aspartate ammonia-lyase